MNKKGIFWVIVFTIVCKTSFSQTEHNKLSKPILDSLILAFWSETVEGPELKNEPYVDVVINRLSENRTRVRLGPPLGKRLNLDPRVPVISFFVLEEVPVIIRTDVFDGILAQYNPYRYHSKTEPVISFYSEAFINFLKETLPGRYRDQFRENIPVFESGQKVDSLAHLFEVSMTGGQVWFWYITFRGGVILDVRKEFN